MVLTLTIRDVAPATPRALIVRLDLAGADFPYRSGQAVEVGRPGGARKPYSLTTPPAEARARGELELLFGLEPSGAVPAWIAPLERGAPGDLLEALTGAVDVLRGQGRGHLRMLRAELPDAIDVGDDPRRDTEPPA